MWNAISEIGWELKLDDVLEVADRSGRAIWTGLMSNNSRWVIMAMAFLITLVNYMDRSAIAYAIKPIETEFHLTDGQLGTIFGAFGLGYAVSPLVGGILVDRFGARKMWSFAAVAWSLMTAALGAATGFWPFITMRTMLGITEGPNFPALTRVVTDWLPLGERARATAFGLVAVPLASLIGAPLISSLIVHLGWRCMFLTLGSVGFVWALAWALLFRDYPEQSKRVSKAELEMIGSHTPQLDAARTDTSLLVLLRNPALVSNNYAFFSFGYLLFFAIHWLPGYLQSTFKLGLQDTGWLLIAPWSCATIMVALAGWLSDHLLKATGSLRVARSHIIWVCQLCSGIAFIPVVLTHSLVVAIIFLSLALGFGLAPNAAFYALNVDLAGNRAGTSLGLMTSLTALSAVLAPWLTGVLKEMTGDFRSAILLMAFFSLSAVLVVLIGQHPDRHMMTRSNVS